MSATIELSGKTGGSYDVDNRAKIVLDFLQKSGIIGNDSQVDEVRLLRRNPGKGLARITLTQAEPLIDL